MASNVLPRVLFMLPRNPTQCSRNNLAFSAAFSHPCPGGLVSRVPARSSGLHFAKNGRNCSFVVSARKRKGAKLQVQESGENVGTVEPEEAELPSDDKPSKLARAKLGDIMGILNKRAVEASDEKRPIPELRTGYIVEIKLEVPDNRRRVAMYKGIIISRQNAGNHTTIRIRRVIAGIGVEIVFPIYSPLVKSIRILNRRKVRRARLYYLRHKLPRFCTFK